MALQLQRSTDWNDAGFGGAIDWLRFNCHLTSTVAADRINVGQHRTEMPESIQAMEAGEIGYAHVKVMARTADAIGDVFDEKALLPLARDNTPGKFHYKCLHYRLKVDPRGHDEQQALLHEGRALRLSTVENGCLLLSGCLDPVDGAAVRTTLEALARPGGRHDDRSREQRLADGFVDAVIGGGRRTVQMQVTASVETLLGLLGAPGAEAEFSLPISSKTAQRWACDCSATRILLQDSVVIDVGRAERTVSGPRRRALEARDHHCRWIGCERPARWCDAHHVVHWLHGGGSELENQVLLCTRHHRMVHEGGWRLIRTDDRRLIAMPPLTSFPTARGPD
jgi:hypothetical protein